MTHHLEQVPKIILNYVITRTPSKVKSYPYNYDNAYKSLFFFVMLAYYVTIKSKLPLIELQQWLEHLKLQSTYRPQNKSVLDW